MHLSPTPRVGGVEVMLALVAAWSVANSNCAQILGDLVLAGLPAFAFGLAVNPIKKVSVRLCLMAMMASGVLGWLLKGALTTGLDIPPLDPLLRYSAESMAFTVFALSGVANSVNIVDGFNGLASGLVVIEFVGWALVVVSRAGDVDLDLACLAIAAAFFGFWFVNWPWGKLFLGDGGSYFSGFSRAWPSVLLIERNPGVSAFTPLLICIDPVSEVLFSIYRRKIKKTNPGHADRPHLHSLIKQRYVRRWFLNTPACYRNSITGLLTGSMTFTAIIMASMVYGSIWQSAAAFVAMVVGSVALYARVVRHHWCSAIDFLLVKPAR